MDPSTARQRFHDDLLARHLKAIFGEVEASSLEHLRQHLRWVEIAGGETLIHQGEDGDSMYLVVSGRLRAYARSDDGSERMVGEMSRGQTVGELSLYTGEPRAATVVAVRDSVLVRLAKSEFTQLLQSSAQVSIVLTRQIVARLKSEGRHSAHDRPVTIGLVPITPGVDLAGFADDLSTQLGACLQSALGHGRVRLVSGADIATALAAAGVALDDPDPEAQSEASRRVRMRVSDSGSGFPAHILQRAFQPYVTTKVRGTGPGLAVLKKIADEYGARIELANRLEDGVVRGAQVSLSFAPEHAVAS